MISLKVKSDYSRLPKEVRDEISLESYNLVVEAGFQDRESRDELRKITRNLVRYVFKNKVKNLLLLDEAARPAALAFVREWRKEYPSEKRPDIYFMAPEVRQDAGASIGRSERALQDTRIAGGFNPEEFRNRYKRLIGNKNQPTLVFDVCSHTGKTINQTHSLLEKEGFSSLKIGLVYEELGKKEYALTSKRKADFVASKDFDRSGCHPFGRDYAVKKGKSYVSESMQSKGAIKRSRDLREAISLVLDYDF
jgi:hypothetical protein